MPVSWARRGRTLVLVGCWMALGIAHFGCKGDDDDDHDHDEGADEDHDHGAMIGPSSGATCPEGSTLSYDTFGKAFMDEYCVKCHSSKLEGAAARMNAPADHDFDIFEGIVGVAEHIDQYAASGPDSTNTKMPPAGQKQPSMGEREMLGEWLACELEKLE